MSEIDYDAPITEPRESLLDQFEAKGKELISVNRQIDDLEVQLKALQARKAEIEYRELPQIMVDARLSGTVTVDNIPIELYDEFGAEIPKTLPERRKAIFDWLVQHGHGGVIQRELAVHLPKGDDAAAHKVMDAIKETDTQTSYEMVENVHWATYKALCKKLMKGRDPVPMELLGIFTRKVAKVKKLKE